VDALLDFENGFCGEPWLRNVWGRLVSIELRPVLASDVFDFCGIAGNLIRVQTVNGDGEFDELARMYKVFRGAAA
jgi:hypothetical protein